MPLRPKERRVEAASLAELVFECIMAAVEDHVYRIEPCTIGEVTLGRPQPGRGFGGW
jgi:hypothetical protein